MLKVTIDLKKTPKSDLIADTQSAEEVTFDLEKLPKPVLDCFIADTLRAAEKYYEDPENRKKYEERQKKKNPND